ncbi:GntR family transcriptional regulator [Haloferula sp. BvORR071]|uniref:GntR family transcriptional regulator n=1 Tax=Haloferula sp. BvORR071 TaxID=1396141 RepID=UPI00054EDD88|nr:GntR family transcriptional regulator [Haloferula sp. BvORR071]
MQFSINSKDPAPLHSQVEVLLRKLIAAPKYQQGKLLPPEAQMAAELGISRNTVRAAISRLVQEGLLERKAGVGTRVLKHAVATKLADWASFTGEMLQKGIRVQTFSLEVAMIPADDEVFLSLGIERHKKGERLLRMARVRGYDDIPAVYSVSWFHPRTGLAVDDDFSTPLYELIRRKSALVAQISREEIRAGLADTTLATRLDCKAGLPILERRRVAEDGGSRQLEFNLNYYRSDRFTYSITIERNHA